MGLEQCRSRKIKTKSLLLILIFLGFVLNKRGAYGQQKPPTNIGGFSCQNRPYRNSHSIMIAALSAPTNKLLISTALVSPRRSPFSTTVSFIYLFIFLIIELVFLKNALLTYVWSINFQSHKS